MESVDLDSLIGKSLDNRFELKKLIGQGGYGAVFEAVQTSMHRRCAVKVLSIQTDDPKQIARFELEARVTCQLTHPNTIVVYEYGRDTELGVFFIAMEFLDGMSLTDFSNSRTLSLDDSLHILGQIADSLDDAHTYDLVHRDIKPHNVMVVKRGNDDLSVKVIDFGIAKTQEKGLDLTQTDTIIGTPEYMSTEQVLNKKLSGKSDQYALAVTAYYLLTGRTLFNCETALQIAVAHASEIPPAISTVTDRFLAADQFDAALLRALSKDPDERFDTCREFVDALEANKPEPNPDSNEYLNSPPKALSTDSFAQAVAKTEAAPVAVKEIVKETEPEVSSPDINDELFPLEKTKNNKKMLFLVFTLAALVAVLSAFILFIPEKDSKIAYDTKAEASEVRKIFPPEKKEKIEVDNIPVAEKAEPKNAVEPVIKTEKLAPAVEKEKKDRPKTLEKKAKVEKKAVSSSVSKTLQNLEKSKKKEDQKAAEKSSKKVAKKGVVKIFTTPWGDIYVDGKKRSSKSRLTVKLSPGSHTFSLRQKGVSKARTRLVVKSGENHRIRLSAD